MADDSGTLANETRLEGETDKAFAAFCVYRDLPPQQRSLLKVADLLGYEVSDAMRKQGKAGGSIDRWSQKFRWRQRAAACDTLQECRRQNEQAEVHQRMVELRLAWLDQFKDKMFKRIEQFDPAELKPLETIRLLDMIFKIEDRTFARIEKSHQPTDAGRLFADMLKFIDADPAATEPESPDAQETAADSNADTAANPTNTTPADESTDGKAQAISEKPAEPISNRSHPDLIEADVATDAAGSFDLPKLSRKERRKARKSRQPRINRTEHLSICPTSE